MKLCNVFYSHKDGYGKLSMAVESESLSPEEECRVRLEILRLSGSEVTSIDSVQEIVFS